MTNIGSSSMLIGIYFAVRAKIGAIMIVGRSMRLTSEAIRRFLSSFGSSIE